MKFYIASHSKFAAETLASIIEHRGHKITSGWIKKDTKFGSGDYTDGERRSLALMDEEDVRSGVDGLILLASLDGENVPGGKHVETGIALALGYPIFVIGRRENVFHWHPSVKFFQDAPEFLDTLS